MTDNDDLGGRVADLSELAQLGEDRLARGIGLDDQKIGTQGIGIGLKRPNYASRLDRDVSSRHAPVGSHLLHSLQSGVMVAENTDIDPRHGGDERFRRPGFFAMDCLRHSDSSTDKLYCLAT